MRPRVMLHGPRASSAPGSSELPLGAKLKNMADEMAATADSPSEPDIDENGVDLTQIRQMLDLEPAKRLSRMAELMDSLLAIRTRNGIRGSR